MQLDIKVVKFDCDGDGITGVYVNGKLHTQGDYYHDKIDDWIEGWIAGLKYAKVKLKTSHYGIPTKDDDYVCEAPGAFDKAWLKHKQE